MKLVIGTRGSRLALAQSEHIRDRLLAHPGTLVESVSLQIIKTRGDKILDVALNKVGGKGLFTKELEDALLAHEVDLAVHSLKDMPSSLPPGLTFGAITTREDPRDAWVLPKGAPPAGIDALPEGAIVGTSSLRRQCQLLARRPDLRIVPVRGNVETRLRKLDEGEDGMVAMVLAAAGLRRLDLADRITAFLDPAIEMIPAVGQGALALEHREGDEAVAQALAVLADPESGDRATAERAFLATIEGGCQVPAGAHATVVGTQLHVAGFVGALDGGRIVRDEVRGARADAVALGQRLARQILDAGGASLMAELSRSGGSLG